ncbi:uncharacterized protein [Dermacentor andersoni]|uniref:uncharacterized protein n=1 Tax=Dermacentor andersoni TaxID=34620 RepID=UPI003B3ACCCE
MNLWIPVALVWLTFYLWHCAESCYNNQRLSICPRKRRVFQELCPGVREWKCNYFTLRCACVRKTARRADGKCVKPAECSQASVSSEDTVPKNTTIEQLPDTEVSNTEAEQFPNRDDHVTLSVGPHGCPQDHSKCRERCKTHGFQDGRCDYYVHDNCYCTGHTSPPHQRESGYTKGKFSSWPYGCVGNTGELVRQLKEKHGCPGSKDDCSYECMQLGFDGAFCGYRQPNYCFCKTTVSADMWATEEGKSLLVEKPGHYPCTSGENCDMYCTTQEYSGGFCTDAEPQECHCYKMSSYSSTSSLLPNHKTWRPKTEDPSAAIRKLLMSTKKVALLKISQAAWLKSECHCMESAFRQTMSNELVLTVGCHIADVPGANSQNRPTDENTAARPGFAAVTKATADIIVNVVKNNDETELHLRILSDAPELPFDLKKKYKVLAATATCAVLKIAETIGGELICALWGLEVANNNEEDDCSYAIEKLCLQPLSDVFMERNLCGEQYRISELL